MPDATRSLVLCDGDVASILACTALRESLAAAPDAPDDWPLLLPFPAFDGRASTRERAILRLAETLRFRVIPPVGSTAPHGATVGELEARELISAAYAAARAGCARVLWPDHAALGPHIDLDRLAQIADRAFLASRLAASDGSLHGVPGITIDAPYADFTDAQLADAAADLLAPLHLAWWLDPVHADSPEAAAAKARWSPAFDAVGWPLSELHARRS